MSETNKKIGGPYTKEEQEDRRKKVYELHFEKGFSAVSIANELDVNRNTINEDIKYWQMQIGLEYVDQNPQGFAFKFVERIDNQKKRLLENLEKAEIKEKIRLEKTIFEIDSKMIDFVSKIEIKRTPLEKPESKIPEDDAKDVLKDLLDWVSYKDLESISYGDLLREIIVMKHCEKEYADDMISKFIEMGLEIFLDESAEEYDLCSFARSKEVYSTKCQLLSKYVVHTR